MAGELGDRGMRTSASAFLKGRVGSRSRDENGHWCIGVRLSLAPMNEVGSAGIGSHFRERDFLGV